MNTEPATSDIDRALAAGVAAVHERIRRAALRASRDPAAVRLVAVTKSVDAGIIARLVALGVRDLAENRVAQAEERIAALAPGPTWHLIGHLQGNKARRAVAAFPWIHSVDSIPLLERVARAAGELGKRPKVLLQVNVSGEATKTGVAPGELDALAACAAVLPQIEVAGLMTMAPLGTQPEQARPVFRGLRERFDALARDGRLGDGFRHLSMGMTDDFEVAVEEGATLVRVGRALFKHLPGAGAA